jgi:hypothetical protein
VVAWARARGATANAHGRPWAAAPHFQVAFGLSITSSIARPSPPPPIHLQVDTRAHCRPGSNAPCAQVASRGPFLLRNEALRRCLSVAAMARGGHILGSSDLGWHRAATVPRHRRKSQDATVRGLSCEYCAFQIITS